MKQKRNGVNLNNYGAQNTGNAARDGSNDPYDN
jgi:hypothetical protein